MVGLHWPCQPVRLVAQLLLLLGGAQHIARASSWDHRAVAKVDPRCARLQRFLRPGDEVEARRVGKELILGCRHV